MNFNMYNGSETVGTMVGLNRLNERTTHAKIKDFFERHPKCEVIVATSTHTQLAAAEGLPLLGFKQTRFVSKTQHEDTRLAVWLLEKDNLTLPKETK